MESLLSDCVDSREFELWIFRVIEDMDLRQKEGPISWTLVNQMVSVLSLEFRNNDFD